MGGWSFVHAATARLPARPAQAAPCQPTSSRPARPSAVPPCTLSSRPIFCGGPLAEPHHVVVDGSNLATEGRTSPSLKQLDEAVRAYAAEDPDASIIVVVDATFEHRVSDEERDEVRAAMLNGEIISPPAGAIGRGDAFVLRIAERTGAIVLSNDSFQEFHGEHPWLFDEGRLIGGKPVPGVGWIFTPRIPIRGPKSRAATAEAKSKRKDPDSAPAKAAELARAAKKAAKRAPKAKKATTVRRVSTVDTSWPITPTVPPPGRVKVDPVLSSAIEEAVEEASTRPSRPSRRARPRRPHRPSGPRPRRRRRRRRRPRRTVHANQAEQRSGDDRHRRRSTSRWPSSTSSPASPSGPRSKVRWCRSPRTGPWSTWPCPKGECCTATSH